MRRNLKMTLLAAVLCAASAVQAPAQMIETSELSAWLRDLRTAQWDFRQFNADGSVTSGTLYMQRPNRARFEYAGTRDLVLASAGQVAVFDAKSRQGPQQYPMSKTPLRMILSSEVDLERDGAVMGVLGNPDGSTSVLARDPARPEDGDLDILFQTADGISLGGWTLKDDMGTRVTVVLSNPLYGATYPSSLFSIEAEKTRRETR